MDRRRACLALAGAAGALAAGACTRAGDPVPAALLIGGAAAMLPLTQALADAFARTRGPCDIVIERGGSLPAYIAASRGAIDLAAMTRALTDTEDGAGARHYLIARSDIGLVVNGALPVRGLTRDGARALLAGDVANWRAVGGPDLPAVVYAYPRGTTARQSAEQLLLDGGDFAVDARECPDAAALAAALAADPGGIACLDGAARGGAGPGTGLAVLAVDGVAPARAAVLSGRYPYTHSFYLLLHGAPSGVRGDFVRFARSPAGQAIVERLGLVPVC